MIVEKAILFVDPSLSLAFEKDFQIAVQYISSIDGYINHQLMKSVEQPNQYMLLVRWRDIEAHKIGFRTSTVYQKWKALLHHYYDPFPEVVYYSELFTSED